MAYDLSRKSKSSAAREFEQKAAIFLKIKPQELYVRHQTVLKIAQMAF